MPPSFPTTRKRRLRQASWIRSTVQEHTLSTCDLIYPIFIQDSTKKREPIAALPGIDRLNLSELIKEVELATSLGISAVALFPVTEPSLKNDDGTEAVNANNLMCQAIRAIKTLDLNIGIIADVALDPYTSHGHDGIVQDNVVLNDATLGILCDMSLVLTEAGCDVLAPSDMMDGRIGAIRQTLESKGHHDTLLLSYAAKYASAFYGPFREAVGSSGNLKGASKATYQMNPANTHEALHEAALDVEEGADMLMVKPGMPYLDVLWRIKDAFSLPTFAYQVSGEYAMLHHYTKAMGQPVDAIMLESLMAFKRAGADGIFTYAALDVARALRG